MPSPTIENYLKAMFFLANEEGEVSIKDLSERMEVTMPTANSMVKKLEKKGWLIYTKYKPLKITSKGKKAAALILRKHRLTEMYLTEKMGFGWEEVHDIAEQLEHVDSDLFFDRMDELLGYPAIDPHGSPIPDKDGNIKKRPLIGMHNIKAGQLVSIKALNESSDEFLRYLNKINIGLDTKVEVLDKEPFDGSMGVKYTDQAVTRLSKEVSERLMVEVIEKRN